jgi:hypothetical protein
MDKINGKNKNISVNMETEALVAVQRKHSRVLPRAINRV